MPSKPIKRIKFVSWWKMSLPGEYPEVWTPFYVDENGSHVSDETLMKRGVPIPATPTLEAWNKMTREKIRCRFCFHALRGSFDLKQHFQSTHQMAVL